MPPCCFAVQAVQGAHCQEFSVQQNEPRQVITVPAPPDKVRQRDFRPVVKELLKPSGGLCFLPEESQPPVAHVINELIF